MKTIVEEKPISFKELEQKIFSYVCELGREITTAMLEAYDKELAEGRDKKNYRDKGIRTTTIKTVYGEVSYGRHVYQTKLEDGKKACVYLLDEAMKMENNINADRDGKIIEIKVNKGDSVLEGADLVVIG